MPKPAVHSLIPNILGLRIDNVTMNEALDSIMDCIKTGRHIQVSFVNADCANIACKNPPYKESLIESDYVFADGIGVKIAGKLLKTPIRDNVNGTDMFPLLCKRLSGTGYGIYLLGAWDGVAQGVAEWIGANYPDVKICGVQQGYYDKNVEDKIVTNISKSNAAVLLVAFGAPRQELWIAHNMTKLNVNIAIGVGGLFDFYSGRIPRAPVWMRKIGMEWVFRLYQEPGRLWKRYLVGNVVFLSRVVLQKLKS